MHKLLFFIYMVSLEAFHYMIKNPHKPVWPQGRNDWNDIPVFLVQELNVYGLQLQSLVAGILQEMAQQASQQRRAKLVMEGRQETDNSQTSLNFTDT